MNSKNYTPQLGAWKMRHDGELRELARTDISAALLLLEQLSDIGAKVEAQTALYIAVLSLKADTPKELRKPRGRPKGSFTPNGLKVSERTERRQRERSRKKQAELDEVLERLRDRISKEDTDGL
ncbi:MULTISPECIES: hypothetical protein [unclassified Ruegeria]|uniref:hypothetical protein n=1 Tax=unclassified Ruegeria TaxID=2625375 RepID=UPI0014893BFF|nr:MULTISPECIES: hypothetical protein [unclassified Ruegeria]